jgi:hypothetical protein
MPPLGRQSELDARECVLVVYGEVMLIVQFWEQALAFIWWRAERRNPTRATGDFDTPSSQKEIVRLEAAFLRLTAQRVREAVATHLEPAAADDLSELMTERNRLAHRFLRERSADDGDFLPGTYEQLITIGSRFMASFEAAKRVIDGFEPYRGPVLAHWGAVADRITKRLSAGEVVPRDPRLQMTKRNCRSRMMCNHLLATSPVILNRF